MTDSLDDVLGAVDDPVAWLRSRGRSPGDLLPIGGDIPAEFTNWREEQRAWTESAVLMDQSQHMIDLFLDGPDAVEVVADLGVNDFSDFDPGKAKQFVAANPEGYLIGDAVLFHLWDGTLDLVGTPPAIDWVQYHVETGDYDVAVEREGNAFTRQGPPRRFRYQVQGPNALAIMREAIEGDLPDVDFFEFAPVTIDGVEVNALRHGMLSEVGLELFGPREEGEAVREAILAAGEAHDLRQVGMKAYMTNNVNGWLPAPLPAIYGDDGGLDGFREWLGAHSWEARFSVGGSYAGDDVTDYYLTPREAGYGDLIDFDGDFVGKEALRAESVERGRTKVTLIWDWSETVAAVEGLAAEPTTKFLSLPRPHYAQSMYDRIEHAGETVGVSKFPCYRDHVGEMMSLGIVDEDLSDPGTTVTVVWGEEDSEKPQVEPHEEIEIEATVGPVPYRGDRRKTADYTTA